MYSLQQIADLLDQSPRLGRWPDRDRPPGMGAAAVNGGATPELHDKYIRLSDRLAKEFAATLRHHATGDSPRAVPVERR